MSDIQTTWNASNLVHGYFLQEKFWIDAEGEVHTVDEMHPAYCLNVILFLERIAPEIYLTCTESESAEISEYAVWMREKPLYKRIYQRVRESLSQNE